MSQHLVKWLIYMREFRRMRQSHRNTRSQRGNVLFLILLGVVLFAALNYAVTQSMQGGAKDSSSENAEVAAAEIVQWFTAIDNAVIRLSMSGVAYEDMSFTYDAKYYGGAALFNYGNNTRCISDYCRIFKTDGGGVRPADFIKYANPEPAGITTSRLMPGLSFEPYIINWPGAGSSLNDIYIYLTYMSPSVCTAINNKLGITAIPVLSGTTLAGSNPQNWDTSGMTVSSNANQLYGKDTFAGAGIGTGQARYCNIYHLVIKR